MHAGGQGFESLILHVADIGSAKKVFDMLWKTREKRARGASPAGREEGKKGGRWIPRLSEATKGAISCEKPRGGADGL